MLGIEKRSGGVRIAACPPPPRKGWVEALFSRLAGVPVRRPFWALLRALLLLPLLLLPGGEAEAQSAPAAPTGFTATAGFRQVVLRWANPSNNAITGYQYRQGTGSPNITWGEWTDFPESDATTQEKVITGLTARTQYSFQIRAVAGTVLGAASATVSATPNATPMSLAKPSGLTATAGNGQVLLRWTDPSNIDISGYLYQIRLRSSGVWSAWTAIPGSGSRTTTYTVTGLTNGSAYDFRIRSAALDGNVLSSVSSVVMATPLANPPPAAPTGLVADPSDSQVSLIWTIPAGDTITGYQYRQGSGDPFAWGVWTDFFNFRSTYEFGRGLGRLTNGTEYSFQVRAVVERMVNGETMRVFGAASDTVTATPQSPPARPTNFVATAGNAQVTLTWDDPEDDTITAYSYRYGPSGGSRTTVQVSRDTFTVTVTGLTNGTAYDFAVYAWRGEVSGRNITATATPFSTPVGVTPTTTDTTATEGSTTDTATFTVSLNTEPSSDVTVTVTAPAGLTLDGPDSATTFTSSEDLTFTTGNWSTARTVTVRATDDSTDSPIGRELTVTWTSASSDSNYNNGSGDAATVTVVDNDATTVTLAGAAGNITEGGAKTFTVTLGRGLVNGETLGVPLTFGGGATRGTDYTTACPTTLPTGVTCANLDSGNATVTFTGASGRTTATTVTLTLTAATDSTTETGGETVAIGLGTLNASSGTGLGGGASGTGSLSFRINDPSATDTTVPTLSITGVPGTISGTTAFTATFNFSKTVTGFTTDDITVTGGTKGAFAGSGSQYTLVVTPTGGVNVVVTVAANAATDGTNTGPANEESETATWTTPPPPPQETPSGGGGGGGGGTPSASPTAVSVSAGPVVTEGGEALFRITASPAPSDEITVRVRVSATGDFVEAVQLGEKLVTLSASAPTANLRVATTDDDVDEADGTVTVTLLSGDGYTLSQVSASLAVADDDTPALVFEPDTLTVDEGGSAIYTVALATEPTADVTVTVAGTGGEVTVTRNTLVFTASNWSTPQPVTVSAGQDADAADDRARLTHSARGGGYGLVTGSVAVTVEDDDTPDLVLTPAALTVTEGASATYTVALATEPTGNVTVSIAGTGDVTVDRSTLAFHANNWSTAQTVTVLAGQDDDAADDSVTLDHSASGGDYGLVTGSVTVMVTDTGTLVVAPHLARFGRTVAEQALDGIERRLHASRTPGVRGTFTGSTLDTSVEGDVAPGWGHDAARTLSTRDMLLGSSFALTSSEEAAGRGSFALWGRASGNRFDGATNAGATNDGTTAIGLDGEVLTGLVGADYARGDWLFGLALTHSLSEGSYTSEGASAGKVDASLTAALPYVSLQANPRLKLWGAGGYGIGEVTLKTGGASYRADTDWTMAAAGVRGDLLDPAGGPAVALIADGLWARTTSDQAAALAASDAYVNRLRLGIEGSYRLSLGGAGEITPRVEAGARHDGGDAETGAGMEVGAGLAWSAPGLGLTLDVSGRALLTHEDEDFDDRGLSAAFIFDPRPESERGPSLSLRQAIGGRADGGIEALFAATPLGDGGNIGSGAGMRRTLETAYGFSAFGGRFTARPHAEVDFTERARDYALGWRFVPHELASDLAFGIKATRREAETLAPVHVFGVEATVRW